MIQAKRTKWEAHIYMSNEDKTALELIARAQCRSVNAQILHYIRKGLEKEKSAGATRKR